MKFYYGMNCFNGLKFYLIWICIHFYMHKTEELRQMNEVYKMSEVIFKEIFQHFKFHNFLKM